MPESGDVPGAEIAMCRHRVTFRERRPRCGAVEAVSTGDESRSGQKITEQGFTQLDIEEGPQSNPNATVR